MLKVIARANKISDKKYLKLNTEYHKLKTDLEQILDVDIVSVLHMVENNYFNFTVAYDQASKLIRLIDNETCLSKYLSYKYVYIHFSREAFYEFTLKTTNNDITFYDVLTVLKMYNRCI